MDGLGDRAKARDEALKRRRPIARPRRPIFCEHALELRQLGSREDRLDLVGRAAAGDVADACYEDLWRPFKPLN
jgi:hypothetical protein